MLSALSGTIAMLTNDLDTNYVSLRMYCFFTKGTRRLAVGYLFIFTDWAIFFYTDVLYLNLFDKHV